jgi:drug/metabolite transporter (DMT)-like permease
MSDHFSESVFSRAIGPVVAGILGTLLTWTTAGATGFPASPLISVLSLLGGATGLACSILFRRYVGLLGTSAKRKASPDRREYDSLRESLSGGGVAARLYTENFTAFLDATDRFFRDDKMAD